MSYLLRPRYYSRKYDSMMQGEVKIKLQQKNDYSLNINNELKAMYKVLIKLDLLLNGSLVLTDSQFFDGEYFHILADEGYSESDFDDFINFIREFNSSSICQIELRCRKGNSGGDLLYTILSNPKFISSAAGGYNNLYKQAIMEAVQKDPSEKTIEKMSSIALDCVDLSVKNDFKRYINRLLRLKSKVIDSDLHFCKDWPEDKRDGKDLYSFYLEKFSKDYESKLYFAKIGNSPFDSVLLPELIKIITAQKVERSDVEELFIQFANTYQPEPVVAHEMNKLRYDFYSIYNRAIAAQHSCSLFHEYVDNNEVVFSSYDSEFQNCCHIDVPITEYLFDALANESWCDFLTKINSREISNAYARWYQAIKDNTRKDNVNVNRALDNYCKEINRIYRGHYYTANHGGLLQTLIDVNSLLGAISSIAQGSTSPDIIICSINITSSIKTIARFALESNRNTKALSEYAAYTREIIT